MARDTAWERRVFTQYHAREIQSLAYEISREDRPDEQRELREQLEHHQSQLELLRDEEAAALTEAKSH